MKSDKVVTTPPTQGGTVFRIVNIYGEPVSDATFATVELAEIEVRRQWALGWEVYVKPVGA